MNSDRGLFLQITTNCRLINDKATLIDTRLVVRQVDQLFEAVDQKFLFNIHLLANKLLHYVYDTLQHYYKLF